MKKTLIKGLSALLVSMGVIAPLASQDIIVLPAARSAEQFVAEVSNELDSELERVWLHPGRFRGGFAQVHFRIAADGTAEHLTLYRKSGDPTVDRAALKVVRKLDSIGKLPTGYPDDQVVLANILLATTDAQLAQLKRQALRHESRRIAQAGRSNDRMMLALTVSANAPS